MPHHPIPPQVGPHFNGEATCVPQSRAIGRNTSPRVRRGSSLGFLGGILRQPSFFLLLLHCVFFITVTLQEGEQCLCLTFTMHHLPSGASQLLLGHEGDMLRYVEGNLVALESSGVSKSSSSSTSIASFFVLNRNLNNVMRLRTYVIKIC